MGHYFRHGGKHSRRDDQGGYGPALERDPERVRHDVTEGYVSRECAAAVYGVVVEVDGKVDHAATDAFRSEASKR